VKGFIDHFPPVAFSLYGVQDAMLATVGDANSPPAPDAKPPTPDGPAA